MKSKKSLKKTVFAALLAALTAVFTVVLPIPLPGNGYANLGDCFVILAAFLLGPVWGGLAAGIGAAVSDIILGYVIYSPASFVIKFLMGFIAALIVKRAADSGKIKTTVLTTLAAFIAELIMVAGYFVYECFLYGVQIAAVDIIGNSIQAAVGIVSSLIIFTVLVKTKVFDNIKNRIDRE